jgi:hypothetical protein
MNTVGEGFWGEPGYGKTAWAQARMIDRAGERGVPCVILDMERNLRLPGAIEIRGQDPDAIIPHVWDDGSHVIYTPPQGKAYIERFFGIVNGGGNVCLLCDEVSTVAKGEGASPALLHLCQTRRPYGVDLYFTSTQPQDLHATAWSVITKVWVFKTKSAFAMDRLKRERHLSDEQVRTIENLDYYQCVEC